MTKVPLVIYDALGERKVIGTADAEMHENGAITVKGEITDERYKGLVKVNNPDWYSIGLIQDQIVESVIVPPPVFPGGRAQFTAEIAPLEERDWNDD